MKTQKSTFRILFYLKKGKKLQDGECPIFMRITVNGQRTDVATHRSIPERMWNQEKMMSASLVQKGQDLNDYLDLLKEKVYFYKRDLETHDEEVTARILGDLLQGRGTLRKGLLELFMEHNAQCRERIGRGMAEATVVRYETTQMHIRDFLQKKYRQKEIALRSITPQVIRDFEHYLGTIRKCNTNTTIKYIRNLRKIIRIALSNDWIKKDPFRTLTFRLKDVNREYLSDPELKLLIEKPFSNDRLQRVKDVFLFCCFTGLAFSDVKNLTRENLIIGINGQWWLKTKRKKTGNPSEIPLFEIPLEILKKFENDPVCIRENKLLPVNSNQKMNAYLKEIADICGINKKMTTHTARHTFATTVTLTHGVSMEAVSKMLGHSSLYTTKLYARIVDTLVSDEMAKSRKYYDKYPPSNDEKNVMLPRLKAK
jgi:site-specific recombinase XerD